MQRGNAEEYEKVLEASKKEMQVKQKKLYDTVVLYLKRYSRTMKYGKCYISLIERYVIISTDIRTERSKCRTSKKLGAKNTEEQEQVFLSIISTKTPEGTGWIYLPVEHPRWPVSL